MTKNLFHLLTFVLLSFSGMTQFAYATEDPFLEKVSYIQDKPTKVTDKYKRPTRFLVSGKSTQTSQTPTVKTKVIDVHGQVVSQEQVNIDAFLDKGMKVKGLPENSLFVLFYGNTAYYLAP